MGFKESEGNPGGVCKKVKYGPLQIPPDHPGDKYSLVPKGGKKKLNRFADVNSLVNMLKPAKPHALSL